MFANCSMPGMDMAMPDVCKSPVPVPYPNMAMKPMAVPPTTSMKYMIMFMSSHNLATTIPTSLGDNTGVLGGVASQTMMGPARNTKGSTKIITSGMPATRMLDTTMQNLSNCIGTTLVPGQFKVVYLS